MRNPLRCTSLAVALAAAIAMVACGSDGSTTSHALSTSKTGAGTGTINGAGIDCGTVCSVSSAPGTVVTLVATPDAGCSVASWSGCDTANDATCTLIMNGPRTVMVTFTMCSPQCSGRQCGGDGCRGSCGTCPAGQSCDGSGQCQANCTCAGRQCGADSCGGGNCGTCPAGQSCDGSGQCQGNCTCSGRQCGPDSCGNGSCGTCPAGQTCNANGQCLEACSVGEQLCNGTCTKLQEDRANCGACGVACGSGQTCSAGTCVATALTCNTGQTACGSTCVDLATDTENCGACGRSCPAGSRCNIGACFVTTCPGSKIFCHGGSPTMPDPCIDPQSDPKNCGACGQVCATNFCSNGVCAAPPTCAPGDLECGSTCVSPSTDVKNCGGCGKACGADEVCTNAQCRGSCPRAGDTICPPSTTDLPPYCTDLATDPSNCGTCHSRCTGPNDVCDGGTCVAGGQQLCSAGQTWCAANQWMNPAGCYDLQTDGSHCGACDAFPCHSMLFGPGVCVSGVCVYTP